MRILIVDRFFQQRDPAQTDMYAAIAEKHYCTFTSDPMEHVMTNNYDILYLGIYHASIAVHNKIDWNQVLFYNRQPVIIDQADNEEFVERDVILKNPANVKCVLSRYLPNDKLEGYCKDHGVPCLLLPWYVNPDRFYTSDYKKYDISFMGSLYGDRKKIAGLMDGLHSLRGMSVLCGEVYGQQYIDNLAASYIAYMECGRKCLTQKYIEASLADCVLVGDKPLYPANELEVYEHIPDDYTNMGGNREYILRTFANKEVFIKNFNELLE